MKRALCLLLPLFILCAWSRQNVDAEDFSARIQFDAVTYDDGEGTPLTNCASVSYDALGHEVLVADPGTNRIIIYDEDLTPKYSFQHFVSSPDQKEQVPGEPRSIATTSRGEFIVADNLVRYIDLLDFRGTSLEQYHLNKIFGDTALILRAEAVTCDANDNTYVLVGGDMETVFVLDQDFKLKRTVGMKGDREQDFNTPVGIAVFDSLIVVTDLYAKPAVKVFDTAGSFLRGFGGHDIDRSDFSLPSGVTAARDSSGSVFIWISDALRQTIKVFAGDGTFMDAPVGYGQGVGDVAYPAGIATNGRGLFYVVERVGRRLQRFRFR